MAELAEWKRGKPATEDWQFEIQRVEVEAAREAASMATYVLWGGVGPSGAHDFYSHLKDIEAAGCAPLALRLRQRFERSGGTASIKAAAATIECGV